MGTELTFDIETLSEHWNILRINEIRLLDLLIQRSIWSIYTSFYLRTEHNIRKFLNLWSRCATIASLKLFVWSLGMSKRLKLSGTVYRRLKGKREEILTKNYWVHWCTCNEGRKKEEKWWESWRTSSKSKTHNRVWNTRPISVCVWLYSSRCFIIPYTFSKHKT